MTYTFKMTNKGKFKISDEAIERMLKFRQDTDDKNEAGGVLLGRFIIASKNIIIDEVTIPMIGDKSTRYSYVRNAKSHQRIIDNKWLKSNGTCNYLGEWHTHPESYPTPSNTDIENWKDRLGKDSFSSRYLYFIIVGIKELRVWEGDRRTLKIKRLEIYEN